MGLLLLLLILLLRVLHRRLAERRLLLDTLRRRKRVCARRRGVTGRWLLLLIMLLLHMMVRHRRHLLLMPHALLLQRCSMSGRLPVRCRPLHLRAAATGCGASVRHSAMVPAHRRPLLLLTRHVLLLLQLSSALHDLQSIKTTSRRAPHARAAAPAAVPAAGSPSLPPRQKAAPQS
jgi:hypothetical protein